MKKNLEKEIGCLVVQYMRPIAEYLVNMEWKKADKKKDELVKKILDLLKGER